MKIPNSGTAWESRGRTYLHGCVGQRWHDLGLTVSVDTCQSEQKVRKVRDITDMPSAYTKKEMVQAATWRGTKLPEWDVTGHKQCDENIRVRSAGEFPRVAPAKSSGI